MPSPPKKGESESAFVTRCIPVLLNEKTTTDPKQAAAICYSIYKRKHKKAKGELSLTESIADEMFDQTEKLKNKDA